MLAVAHMLTPKVLDASRLVRNVLICVLQFVRTYDFGCDSFASGFSLWACDSWPTRGDEGSPGVE